MHYKLKPTSLLFFFFFSFLITSAQSGDTLEIQRSKYNTIKLARFKPDNSGKRKMQNAQDFLLKALSAKPSDELLLIQTETDNIGVTHKKFQQRFKGIPVEGEGSPFLVQFKSRIFSSL